MSKCRHRLPHYLNNFHGMKLPNLPAEDELQLPQQEQGIGGHRGGGQDGDRQGGGVHVQSGGSQGRDIQVQGGGGRGNGVQGGGELVQARGGQGGGVEGGGVRDQAVGGQGGGEAVKGESGPLTRSKARSLNIKVNFQGFNF